MSLHFGQNGLPPRLRGIGAGIAQVAVLPWRKRKGQLELCLVTSRGTGRWIVPKGWPMRGRSPAEAAEIEAWEEAGLKGTVCSDPLGVYSFIKQTGGTSRPLRAVLFSMRVHDAFDIFPECRDRKRVWLRPKKAATRLTEPELVRMVQGFSAEKSKR